MDLRFYHLTTSNLETTLPKLLKATISRDRRAMVRFGNEPRAKWFDEYLWSHDERGFLPHGRQGGAHDADQPILLGHDSEDAGNAAEFIFWVDGFQPKGVADWTSWSLDQSAEVLSLVFSGNDDAQMTIARQLYRKALDLADVTPTYWKQDEAGRWQKAG